MQMNVLIRKVNIEDAEEILEIYAPYVTETAITFEYEVPSIAEFRDRIEKITKKYPYLVAVINEKIVGYAYASTFKDRAAYDWSAELSIYLKKEEIGHGVGRILYEALEKEMKERGFLNLYACIAYPEVEDEYLTKNSAKFHEHLGYKLVGEFQKCGYKFGRWYNMIWMEKIIGEHKNSDSL